MDAESASPVEASSPRTPDEMFAQVYARLKAMASRQRRGGASADTLNTTALVHELYIKLNQGRELSFADQAQFFAYAARALRHILIDSARARLRDRRDAGGKLLDIEAVDLGNLATTASATEKPIRGEVIAAGTGKILEDGKVRPIAVKAGDKVLFGKYSGTEVKVDGEELLVMREEDIMAVIEG